MIQGLNGIEVKFGEGKSVEFIPSPSHPQTEKYHQWVNRHDHFGLLKHTEFREKDVHLWLIDYTLTKDVTLKFQIPALNVVSLFYTIGDDVSYAIKGISKGIAKTGYFNMVYLPRADIELKLRKSKRVMVLGINFTPEELRNLGTPPVLFPMLQSTVTRRAKLLTVSQDEFVILARMKVIIDHLLKKLDTGRISLMYPFRFEFISLIYLSFQITGLYRADQKERDIAIIKAYIEDHLATVTVPVLIERFEYNKAALRLLFIKHTGLNALNYIRKAKLDRAMQLLQDGEKVIKMVAKTVGYKRASSFAVAFKNHHGSWPHEIKGQNPQNYSSASYTQPLH